MAWNYFITHLFMILQSGPGLVKTASLCSTERRLGWPHPGCWTLFQVGLLTWWCAGAAVSWELSWGWWHRVLVLGWCCQLSLSILSHVGTSCGSYIGALRAVRLPTFSWLSPKYKKTRSFHGCIRLKPEIGSASLLLHSTGWSKSQG